MWHVRGRREAPTRFRWGYPKDEHNLKDLVFDEKLILKCIK
jgi:hypothetical protein